MEQMLESGGFDVIAAPSGDAALQLLVDSEAQFAGLITDIRLGDGIDGWALARKARELVPDICENGGAKLDHGSGGEVLLRAA
jgi:CheY-like chemotaxis protein